MKGRRAAALASAFAWERPLLFDGGLASELERRDFDLGTSLWSARALGEAPELVRAIHEDYLRAGADVITTASYQASFAGFSAAGIESREAERLIRCAVRLAREAQMRTDGSQSSFVAGSCGPYGAALGGGREYDGDYGEVAATILADFHRRRLEILIDEGVDLIIFETLPRRDEARVIADLLEDLQTGPGAAILSFQLSAHDRLADGSPFAQAIEDLNGRSEILAIGINCCAPSRASAGLDLALRRSLKPLVVQANSGEIWDQGRWLPAPRGEDLVNEARQWLERGARAIGGCCRTGPKDVAALRRSLGS